MDRGTIALLAIGAGFLLLTAFLSNLPQLLRGISRLGALLEDTLFLADAHQFEQELDNLFSGFDPGTERANTIQTVNAERKRADDALTDALPPEYRCPYCSGVMRRRTGRHGPFYGCSNYPQCRYTKDSPLTS